MSWCVVRSNFFTVVNGVEQGAVLSPALFCVCTGDLMKLLCDAGFSCTGTQFVGALAHADDSDVSASTANEMRKMLAICDDFALRYSTSFNTSKSKWLAILPSSRHALYGQVDQCQFFLNDKQVERVKSLVTL